MIAGFVWTPGRLILASALLAAALLAVTTGAMAMADGNADPVPPGEAQRLGGGELQRSALSDGFVTQAEYSDAFQRTLGCLDNAGIPYVVSNNSQGRPRYNAGPFDSKAELDAAKPALDACYAEHLHGIDVARAAAEPVSGSE